MKLTYSAIKIEFMWSYDYLGIRLLPHILRLLFTSFFLMFCKQTNCKQQRNLQYQFISCIDIKYLVT